MDSRGNAAFFSECLTDEQAFTEAVMLGLRKTDGFMLEEIKTICPDLPAFLYKVRLMPDLLFCDGINLKCTSKGLDLLDTVLEKLL